MKKLLALGIFLVLTVTGCGQSAGRINNQGNEAFARQEYDAALEAYRNAQVESPDLAEPYYNAANTYYRQSDFEQAALQGRQALRNATGSLAENGFYNLGNTAFQAGQFEQAVEAYKEALRLNPADQDAKYNLELALQKLQDQQKQEDQKQQDQQKQEDQQQQQDQQKQEDQQQQQDQQKQEEQQDQQKQPEQQNQPQPQKLTEDQARQLLQAIANNTQTLQEKLQQIYVSPGGNPDKDW